MRVLFTCCPGYGHLHPMVPLARALAAQGHEVAFATAEGFLGNVRAAGFRGFASGRGFEAWGAELTRRVGGPPGDGVRADRIMEYWIPRLFAEVGAADTADDLVPLARSWQPRLIIHETSEFAGPLAAAAIGVPSVHHSLGPLYPPEVMDLAGEALEPLWRRWGLTPPQQGGAFATVCLGIAPPSLETPGACPPKRMWPLRCVDGGAERTEEPPQWIVALGDVPPVHATLGTAITNQNQEILGSVIRGLAGEPVHLIVTVGQNNDPSAFDPLPDNVRVEKYIAHSLLLPRCRAIIAHGGAGTMFTALRHGLPQLFLPQGADQFTNSARCVEAGCARRLLPDEVTPDSIRDELHQLIGNPRYRDAAHRVRDEMEAMPSPDEVARDLTDIFAAV